MSWLWFGIRSRPPAQAYASAPVATDSGSPAGFVAAWASEVKRPRGASKIDARAVDPDGPAGWVSVVVPPAEQTLPFDDPAVAEAIRRVLALPPADVCSTLSLSDDRWAGALTAMYERDSRLDGDPFAILYPARILHVESGFLGHTPALPGPVMQRYGGGNPWPWDRF